MELPRDRFALCAACDQLAAADIAAREARDVQGRIDAELSRSNLPLAYRDGSRTIDSIERQYARRMSEEVLTGAVPGVYIHGVAGPEKTTMAAATLAAWIRSAPGRSGRYVSAADLLSDIHATYSDASGITRNDLVKPLIEAQALVIDDIGKERASEHAAGVIFQILDGRYRLLGGKQRRVLMITSNYSLDELCMRFRDDAIADPIRRRISELTVGLEMR